MIRRGAKIAIIVITVVVILIAIAIPNYFTFFNKTVYQLSDVSDVSQLTINDFSDKSEIQLYKNGTFHLHIELKENGTVLTGIGTYSLDNKNYKLKFIQAYGQDNDGNIVNCTDQCNDETQISCTRSGNRIKFSGFKSQTFYFG